MRVETVHAEVMHMVIADQDRSVEKAVDLAIAAGIRFERARFRSILELKVPPARGIEQAIVVMALAGSSLEEIKQFADFQSNTINAEELARLHRAEFQIVGKSQEESIANAG